MSWASPVPSFPGPAYLVLMLFCITEANLHLNVLTPKPPMLTRFSILLMQAFSIIPAVRSLQSQEAEGLHNLAALIQNADVKGVPIQKRQDCTAASDPDYGNSP